MASTGSISREVIVVDNGSTDGSVEMVRAEFPEVFVLVNSRNEGFAKPNNDAIRRAKGRFFFLLNTDTIIEGDAIGGLARFLDSHHDAGACGPRLAYPDGRTQHTVKGFPTLWTHLCDMLFLDRLFPRSRLFGRGEMSYFDYDRTQEVDHVMAAAFMVRAKMTEAVGLFDERFFIYFNDMDWCYRMRLQEWKIYYVHDARVIHYHGQTVSQVNRNFQYFRELHENVMLFYLKHYGRWSLVLYKLILVAGFIVRSVGWTMCLLIRPSAHASTMARFSWKTLALGMAFWTPISQHN